MRRGARRSLLWSVLILAGLGIAGWVRASRFEARVESDMAEVRELPPTPAVHANLPPVLAAYLARAVPPAAAGTRWFRIEQAGEMRLNPGDGWKAFTAVQVFAVSEPSFVWRASFAAFQVVDSLVRGVGRLEARIFGIFPVANASGAETTRAQLLRYLAEVVWVPRAISDNRFLSWQQLGESEVLGVVEHSGQRVELRLSFDGRGDVTRVEGLRERAVEGGVVPTPWVGVFSDYRTVGGVRIPAQGEVRWMLDSGPFVYWRGTVTSLSTN